MAAVAERLIAGLAATTKCNTIANFIDRSIGGFNRDLTAHPKRTDCAGLFIFNHSDGRPEFRFDLFPSLFVPSNQAARWAISRFFDGNSFGLRII